MGFGEVIGVVEFNDPLDKIINVARNYRISLQARCSSKVNREEFGLLPRAGDEEKPRGWRKLSRHPFRVGSLQEPLRFDLREYD